MINNEALSTGLSEENRSLLYSARLDMWLKGKRLCVKRSSYMRYFNIIEKHIRPGLGGYYIDELDNEAIEAFLLEKAERGRLDGKGGLSAKSISDIAVVLKGSLSYGGGYSEVSNITVPLRRVPKEMRVLTPEETRRLTEFLLKDTDKIKMGVFLCLYTGIRIGELCALRWKSISFKEKIMKIEQTVQRIQCEDASGQRKTEILFTEPKSFSAIRSIPLPDFLIDVMKAFRQSPESFLLSGKENATVEPRTLQNIFRKYLKESGIEYANFHALRHTFATRCVECGFDVKTLSEILGHSSVKITMDRYVHSSLELKRENMDKLYGIIL